MKVSLAHLPKEEEPKEIQELERIKEEDLPGIPLAKKKTHISAWRYLKSRGITNQMIEQYQIRYDLIGDYQGRVIIPIRYRGDLVGFQGRAIQDIHPKYRFGEGFQASRVLFNYDRAIESDLVIIMEGIFDVFSSPENSVAVFTNRLSDAQRFLIIQAGWKEAIVMLDRDEMDSSRKIRKQLSPFLPTKVARIQTKDPGEATPDQIREAIRTAGSGLSIL